MFHMSAALAYGLDVILLLANFTVTWLIARSGKNFLRKTGSPDRALYRVNILSKYVSSLILAVTVGGISFLTISQWKPAIHRIDAVGKLVPLLLPFLTVLIISVINQLILYPTIREIRQTTDSRKEQLGVLVRFLLLIPIMLYNAVFLWLPESGKHLMSSNHLVRFLGPAFLIVMINLVTPLFLAKTLKASPMMDGELKEQLLDFSRGTG